MQRRAWWLLAILVIAGVAAWQLAGDGRRAPTHGTPSDSGGTADIGSDRSSERPDATSQLDTDPTKAGATSGDRGARTELAGGPDTATSGPRVFRIVDAATERGIVGAQVYRAHPSTPLGVADADGLVRLPESAPPLAAMLFVADGYLLAVFPLGSRTHERIQATAAANELRVPLVRDVFSVRGRLRFVSPDGEPTPVRARFVPLGDPPPTLGSVPVPIDGTPSDAPADVLRDAWQHHTQAAMLAPPGVGGARNFGLQSAGAVVELPSEAVVHFVAAGPYAIEAVAASGARALQAVHVHHDAPPVTVRLAQPESLSGVVLGDGAPLSDATVVLEPTPLGVAPARTDAEGRFRFPSCLPGSVDVVVEHRFVVTPYRATVTPGPTPLRITLALQPARVVRGVVRSRGRDTPLSDATVQLVQDLEVVGEARTGVDGGFEVATRASDPELRIRAAGHLLWREAVTPDGAWLTFALVPDSPEARVAAGVSAVLTGELLDAAGAPAPGRLVSCVHEGAAEMPGILGRRILEGAVVPVSGFARTDADGRFTLEVARAGDVQLLPADGDATQADAVRVSVVLGRTLDGFRLRVKR